MKSDSDWREKYLDSLDKIEALERNAAQWEKLETVFRLLATRLCLAGQGRDSRLDEALRRVSDRVRAQADAVELQSAIDALSGVIAALDAEATEDNANVPGEGKPIPPSAQSDGGSRAVSADALAASHETGRPAFPGRADARATNTGASRAMSESTARLRAVMSAAVATTLEKLSTLPELLPALHRLQEKPASQISPEDLATALQNLTGIIGEQRSRLHREKQEVEGLLTQMSARLDEIAAHLAGDLAQQRVARDSSSQLNALVMEEVHEMTTRVQSAADLAELRKQVSGRLDAISAHFQDFRAREEERFRMQIDRAERMRARIVELEKESHALQESLKQEQRSALLDALTGIPNRAAYDERVAQEFDHWQRNNTPLCILAWDIDHFKTINDQYGHKAGDKVLRIIGQHLAQNVRGTDFVARYGGEEFVMLLTETTPDQALLVAEKIRQGIASLGFHFRNMPVTVTASCGITECRAGDTIDGAFERADGALYRAKNAGRNRCVAD